MSVLLIHKHTHIRVQLMYKHACIRGSLCSAKAYIKGIITFADALTRNAQDSYPQPLPHKLVWCKMPCIVPHCKEFVKTMLIHWHATSKGLIYQNSHQRTIRQGFMHRNSLTSLRGAEFLYLAGPRLKRILLKLFALRQFLLSECLFSYQAIGIPIHLLL